MYVGLLIWCLPVPSDLLLLTYLLRGLSPILPLNLTYIWTVLAKLYTLLMLHVPNLSIFYSLGDGPLRLRSGNVVWL
jgi:hypothetical protein